MYVERDECLFKFIVFFLLFPLVHMVQIHDDDDVQIHDDPFISTMYISFIPSREKVPFYNTKKSYHLSFMYYNI